MERSGQRKGEEGEKEGGGSGGSPPLAKEAVILLTPTVPEIKRGSARSSRAAVSSAQQSTREEVRTCFHLNKAAGEEVTPFPPLIIGWAGFPLPPLCAE